MTLKEQYRAICKEYARQTGKIIGYEPQFFLHDRMAVNTCLFGDNYFLNMDQMQQIVDHMDKWLRHYGTIEKVGERVVAWLHYCIDKGEESILLWPWMAEIIKPGSNLEEFMRLEKQVDTLEKVAETYQHHSLDNVIRQMKSRMKELENIMEGEK